MTIEQINRLISLLQLKSERAIQITLLSLAQHNTVCYWEFSTHILLKCATQRATQFEHYLNDVMFDMDCM
jgi:hypothetical protein